MSDVIVARPGVSDVIVDGLTILISLFAIKSVLWIHASVIYTLVMWRHIVCTMTSQIIYYDVSNHILWHLKSYTTTSHSVYYDVSNHILWRLKSYTTTSHSVYYDVSNHILWLPDVSNHIVHILRRHIASVYYYDVTYHILVWHLILYHILWRLKSCTMTSQIIYYDVSNHGLWRHIVRTMSSQLLRCCISGRRGRALLDDYNDQICVLRFLHFHGEPS